MTVRRYLHLLSIFVLVPSLLLLLNSKLWLLLVKISYDTQQTVGHCTWPLYIHPKDGTLLPVRGKAGKTGAFFPHFISRFISRSLPIYAFRLRQASSTPITRIERDSRQEIRGANGSGEWNPESLPSTWNPIVRLHYLLGSHRKGFRYADSLQSDCNPLPSFLPPSLSPAGNRFDRDSVPIDGFGWNRWAKESTSSGTLKP